MKLSTSLSVATLLAGSIASADTILYQSFNGSANITTAKNSAWESEPMRFGSASVDPADLPGLVDDAPTVRAHMVRTGSFGQAVYLPQKLYNPSINNGAGSGDYLIPADHTGSTSGVKPGQSIPALMPSTALSTFTLEAWAKAPASTATSDQGFDQGSIFDVGRTSDNYSILRLKYITPRSVAGTTPQLAAGVWLKIGGSNQEITLTTAASLDTWHHVAFTFDNSVDTNNDGTADSGALRLFVDGVLAKSDVNATYLGATLRNDFTSTAPFIGTNALNAAGPGPQGSGAFRGWVDDIRLSDTVIDPRTNQNSGWYGSLDAVPEPAALGFLGLGSLLLVQRKR